MQVLQMLLVGESPIENLGESNPGSFHLHLNLASNANRRRQPGQEASHFKTDSSSGRIIIDDETFKPAPKSKDPSDDIAGQAYREQMVSVDGFTRGPGGEVKFHKNTKKRRAEEAAAEAVYGDGNGGDDMKMDDEAKKTTDGGGKKKKKTERVYLGQEFKAKVRFPFRF